MCSLALPETPDKPGSPEFTERLFPYWYSPAGAAGVGGEILPRCVNNPTLDPARVSIKNCGRWNCPMHGWACRRQLLPGVLAQLPAGDYWSTVLHLNRRVRGVPVGDAFRIVKRVVARRCPDGSVVAFTHLEGTTENLTPFPHLHCLLNLGSGRCERSDGSEQLSQIVSESHIYCAPSFPDATLADWSRIDNLPAYVRYAMRAREEDRELPPDQQAPSGGRYRLAYGVKLSGSASARAA